MFDIMIRKSVFPHTICCVVDISLFVQIWGNNWFVWASAWIQRSCLGSPVERQLSSCTIKCENKMSTDFVCILHLNFFRLWHFFWSHQTNNLMTFQKSVKSSKQIHICHLLLFGSNSQEFTEQQIIMSTKTVSPQQILFVKTKPLNCHFKLAKKDILLKSIDFQNTLYLILEDKTRYHQ